VTCWRGRNEYTAVLSILKGIFDSIKGIYWLFNLDSVQRRVQNERLQYQELRRRPSPLHTHSSTKEEPRLLSRVAHCCTLNGVLFWVSVLLFNHLLLPCLQIVLATIFGYDSSTTWFWLKYCLEWTFETLWVLPLFILSRIVNALWFQDISNLAYRYSVGRPKGIGSISTFVADNLFSFIIQILFLIQACLAGLVPLYGVADLLYIFHMCLLYSLYSFEYKWIQMGWKLHQRLAFLENNWPYFLGFGLPLTLLTWWPGDLIISGFLFSVFFPIFIISGNEAEPVVNTNGRRLQLFSFVVAVSNALFTRQVPNRDQRRPQSVNPAPAQNIRRYPRTVS